MDVCEAFLATTVPREGPDQTYYVRRPPGATDDELPYISKPEALIYGYPLANPAFRADLKAHLISMEEVPMKYDDDVYVFDNEHGHAIFATAVNNMPILYNSNAMKQFRITGIIDKYKITIKGPTDTILGLEHERDRANRTIKLRQRGSMHN